MSQFPEGQLERVLGAAAKVLLGRRNLMAASILTNAETTLQHDKYDNWNGGQDHWRLFLGVAADTYLDLENRDERYEVANSIDQAIGVPLAIFNGRHFIHTEITTQLEHEPDWRLRIRQQMSGEGVTNQGRARSDNIAFIEHKGLRFRSRAEVHFYEAMRSSGFPVAPLPVVVQGGIQFHRIEPDFVIFKQGLTMVVEIDGNPFHNEKPSEAHARLKFLTDEGVVVERINQSACDTPEKAREAAKSIIAAISRHKASR